MGAENMNMLGMVTCLYKNAYIVKSTTNYNEAVVRESEMMVSFGWDFSTNTGAVCATTSNLRSYTAFCMVWSLQWSNGLQQL